MITDKIQNHVKTHKHYFTQEFYNAQRTIISGDRHDKSLVIIDIYTSRDKRHAPWLKYLYVMTLKHQSYLRNTIHTYIHTYKYIYTYI